MRVSASQLGLSRVPGRAYACVCVCVYLCGVEGASEGGGERRLVCVDTAGGVMDGNCSSKLWRRQCWWG